MGILIKKKNTTKEEIVDDPILDDWKKAELVEVPKPDIAEDIDELLEKHKKKTVADPIPHVAQVDSEENQLVEISKSEIAKDADDESEDEKKKQAVVDDPIPHVARIEREEDELPEAKFEIADETPEPVPSKPKKKKKIVRKRSSTYLLPNLKLLEDPPPGDGIIDREILFKGAQALEQSLSNFGVQGKVVQVNPGPVITTYEVVPPPGVKVSKIVGLADDLALVMKAKSIRIQAPIPGKAVVGIEVPNPEPYTVFLKEILESRAFEQSDSKLMLGFGKTTSGDPYCADLAKMPHLLIAGATGVYQCVDIQHFVPLHARRSAFYYGGPQNAGIVNLQRYSTSFSPCCRRSQNGVGCAQVGGVRDGEPISHDGTVYSTQYY